jgi:hypothetical protein
MFRSFQLCPKDFAAGGGQSFLSQEEDTMTDFSTTTTRAPRRIRVPGLEVSLAGMLRGLLAPLAFGGKALASGFTAYGQAVYLAYSAPFSHPSQPQRFHSDEDLEGRDPNW